MSKNKAIEVVRIFSFPLQSFKYFFADRVTLCISVCPVISSADSFFCDKNVFWVVEVCLFAFLDSLNCLVFKIEENSTRHITRIIGFIKEDWKG